MKANKNAVIALESCIDGDISRKEYPGEYAYRDGTHLLTYTDFTGNGITKNGIQANGFAMLLHRVGAFEGDMLFDPAMDTVVKYTAGGLVQAGFILHTNAYSVEAKENGVVIHFDYILYDGSGEEGIHGEQCISANWEEE